MVEAGLYVTAGTRVTLPDGQIVKARELSGASNILFRRNSVTGTVEARPNNAVWGGLNDVLHATTDGPENHGGARRRAGSDPARQPLVQRPSPSAVSRPAGSRGGRTGPAGRPRRASRAFAVTVPGRPAAVIASMRSFAAN